MTLLASEYRNPLEVLIRREERTCKGCEGEFKAEAFGKTIVICTKLDAKGLRRNYGKRCKAYKEK
ncbi:MAG TPA: hypothetical protein VIM12_05820 [Noviherbaspirillum sp.]|jgi:hypothetical protein|uniref:hypothetical protein n=1 Tax=Noviherbaspirillum sp. TaxID=1926288 RepID=UPI002F9538F7